MFLEFGTLHTQRYRNRCRTLRTTFVAPLSTARPQQTPSWCLQAPRNKAVDSHLNATTHTTRLHPAQAPQSAWPSPHATFPTASRARPVHASLQVPPPLFSCALPAALPAPPRGSPILGRGRQMRPPSLIQTCWTTRGTHHPPPSSGLAPVSIRSLVLEPSVGLPTVPTAD